MKFESHWPKGSGGVSFYGNYPRFSIFSSGSHFVHQSETFSYFGRGLPKQHFYEV